MIIRCPHCSSTFQVADSAAGRQARCIKCQQAFVVPHPAPQSAQAPQPAPAVPQRAAPDPAGLAAPVGPATVPAGGGRKLLFAILLAAGGFLMLASIAAPWWRFSFTRDGDEALEGMSDEKSREMRERIKQEKEEAKYENRRSKEFAARYHLRDKGEKADEAFRKKYPDRADRKGKSVSIYIWGWECYGGIFNGVVGLLILAWGIVAIFLKALSRWSWIGSAASAVLALVAVVLAVVWWLTTPGKDVIYTLSQGTFLGAFAALAGGAAVLAFGVIGTVTGILAMRRAPGAPQPSAPGAGASAAPGAPGPRPMSRLGLLCMVFIAAGGLAMAGSIAAPWWRLSMTPDGDRLLSSEEKRAVRERSAREKTELREERRDKKDFRKRFQIEERLDKAEQVIRKKYPDHADQEEHSVSAFVWGWECLSGIVSLTIGLIILAWGIVAICLKALGRWSWIGSGASAVLALPVIILAVVWWITTPGKDVIYSISQGAFIGTFAALGGGLAVLASGVVHTIMGMRAMLKAGGAQAGAASGF